jgi:hypothetical protein
METVPEIRYGVMILGRDVWRYIISEEFQGVLRRKPGI